MNKEANVTIRYCAQCRFILRATWMAQELLMTFQDELTRVSLEPSSGGIFDVLVNEELVYSRKVSGKFPESSELKQLVRDIIAPDRELGHSDKKED